MTNQPKIYAACLAAYNSGRLHGAWVDANQDPDDLRAEISLMLKASPIKDAEEWAIHDYDDFGKLSLSEYPDLETVSRLAGWLVEHGVAFGVYASLVGTDFATEERFLEVYQGTWEDETEFAREQFEQLYDLPDSISHYIDYERFARDPFICDYTSEWAVGSSGLYVFMNL